MRGEIVVDYKPKFFRHFNKLSLELQDEVDEAVKHFQRNPDDPKLKVHKLKGKLKGTLSFSVNYAYRVIFVWENPKTAVLVSVGDHDVYK